MKANSLSKTLLALCAVTAIGTAAAATPDVSPATSNAESTSVAPKRTISPEAAKKGRLTRLRNQVGLTPEQETKVTPVISKYVDDREVVMSETGSSAGVKRKKLLQLKQKFDSDIDALLTPEQRAKLAADKAARKSRMEAGRMKADANATPTP